MLVKLGSKTTDKGRFSEVIKGLLRTKALVPSIEPICSLEMQDINPKVIQNGKIRIRLVGIRLKVAPAKYVRCVNSGHTSITYQ